MSKLEKKVALLNHLDARNHSYPGKEFRLSRGAVLVN
jgi:hypothetical protein